MRAGAKLSFNAIVQYPIPLSTRLLRIFRDLIDFPLDLRSTLGARLRLSCSVRERETRTVPRASKNALPRLVSQPQ
jgi:hypothetical protein